MRELDGRVALVSGGGSGIGRGIAIALAGEGMRVVVADIEADAAEAVAAELAASGAEAIAEVVDVSDVASVEALADRCDERYGGVDVLCNNAGVVGHTPIGPESLDSWRWILDVNLFGVVHAINTFVPRMRARVAASGGEAHVVARRRADCGGRLGDHRLPRLEVRDRGDEPRSPRRTGRERHRRLGALPRRRRDPDLAGRAQPAGRARRAGDLGAAKPPRGRARSCRDRGTSPPKRRRGPRSAGRSARRG